MEDNHGETSVGRFCIRWRLDIDKMCRSRSIDINSQKHKRVFAYLIFDALDTALDHEFALPPATRLQMGPLTSQSHRSIKKGLMFQAYSSQSPRTPAKKERFLRPCWHSGLPAPPAPPAAPAAPPAPQSP